MDGVLLIDKPSGLTSHDVVAWARRRLRQRSVGHAGTLDPMATGLLVLLAGKGTRLASVLSGKDKTYDAAVRLGFATDTDDATGLPLGPRSERLPSDDDVRAALAGLVGPGRQRPPAYSAKKISGTRAYVHARRAVSVALAPADVTVRSIVWQGRAEDVVTFRVTATAGFYVRALARDLGERLGCGAHLSALRRTESGSFTIAHALTIEQAEALGDALGDRCLSLAEAVADLPAVTVNTTGLTRVLHGNWLSNEHVTDTAGLAPARGTNADRVAVLAPDGRLVALAETRAGALHPVAVLG